jgi:uncharacterized protein DUF3467
VSGDDDQPEVEISIDARRFAGVFANASQVEAKPDEFTIDFIRVDPRQPRGMVVARVTVSPNFMRSFLDQGERVWQTWVDSTPPPGGP